MRPSIGEREALKPAAAYLTGLEPNLSFHMQRDERLKRPLTAGGALAGRGAAAAARGPKRTKRTKRGLYLGRRPQCSKRQNAQNAGIAGPPAASKRQNAKTPKRTVGAERNMPSKNA